MARVTVEDCIDKVDNRFDLVLLASHRGRMISSGAAITRNVFLSSSSAKLRCSYSGASPRAFGRIQICRR